MAKLILWNILSIDGCFNGPTPWSLDWFQPAFGDDFFRFIDEQLQTASMLLFGRVTYEGMAAQWKTAPQDSPDAHNNNVAVLMNSLPKVVFSSTLDQADWNNTRLVKTDAATEVRRLKNQTEGNIFVFGSCQLCATLLEQGLFDEVRLGIVPIVLGTGEPLFKPGTARLPMKLLETIPLATGCVVLRYAPAPGPSVG